MNMKNEPFLGREKRVCERGINVARGALKPLSRRRSGQDMPETPEAKETVQAADLRSALHSSYPHMS